MSQEIAGVQLLDPSVTNSELGNDTTVTDKEGKKALRPSGGSRGCQLKAGYSTLLGYKSKPNGASSGGTAFHYANEVLLKVFQKTGHLMSKKDYIEICDMNWKHTVDIKGSELKWGKDDTPNKMENDLVDGCEIYHHELSILAPQVHKVEPRYTIALPKESSVYFGISGSTDLVTRTDGAQPLYTIRDYKFTGRAMSADKARWQQYLYKIMLSTVEDIPLDDIRGSIENVVRSGKTVPVKLRRVTPTSDRHTHNSVVRRIYEIIEEAELWHFAVNELDMEPQDALEACMSSTTPQDNFLCSEMWCGFWDMCPMTTGRQVVSITDILKQKIKRG